MSLTSALRKVAYATPLVFAAAAANVNAAPPKTVELSDLNLSKPIPTNVCFADSSEGQAITKLNTAMKARKQILIAPTEQAVVAEPGGSPYREQLFTSTLKGEEGYMISSNAPSGQVGTGYCMIGYKSVNIYNVFTQQAVPPEVNKGELGVALRNGQKNGLKVLMTAETNGGALLALQFNPTRGGGGLSSADANGNTAGNLGYMNKISYSPKAKELLGIPADQSATVAAYQPR